MSSEGVESESESALVGNSTRKSRLDGLDVGDEPERTSGRLDSSLIVHACDGVAEQLVSQKKRVAYCHRGQYGQSRSQKRRTTSFSMASMHEL